MTTSSALECDDGVSQPSEWEKVENMFYKGRCVSIFMSLEMASGNFKPNFLISLVWATNKVKTTELC